MAQSNHSATWASRNGRRVAPAPDGFDSMVEVRPKRTLRIRRLNPKDRDEKFEKEMQAFIQYKNSTKGLAVGRAAFTDGQGNGNSARSTQSQLPDTQITVSKGSTKIPAGTGATNSIANHQGNVQMEQNLKVNTENRKTATQGWVSDSAQVKQPSLQNHLSPSRLSMISDGVQSTSGVQLAVNRQISDTNAMRLIGEASVIEDDTEQSVGEMSYEAITKSAKSPRKTKGHRPVSARSLKHRKSSKKSTTQLSDLDTMICSHKNSPYKDVTLFFIHGVGGSSEIWNAQLEFFAGFGVEVIAPDLIGHGNSLSPGDSRAYHFSEILEDLEAVFDRYCKRQNVVIGHSYGCAFTAILGRTRSRRVAKLVFMSGGAPIPLAPQPGLFSLPVCLLSCFKSCLLSRFERDAFYDPDLHESKIVAFDVSPAVLSYVMNGQDWLEGDELYHSWLSMPTLLLYGKHDKFVTLEDELEMEKAIYHSHLEVLNNASHMVMMDAPGEVCRLLYEFIYLDQPPPSTRRSHDLTTPSPRKPRSKNIK